MTAPGAAMETSRSRLAHPVIAWGIALLAVALFITFGIVFFSPLTSVALFRAGGGAITAFWLFPYASLVPVGLLIALRRPTSAIGWLALCGAALLILSATGALVGSILFEGHNGLAGPVLLVSALWNSPGGGVLTVLLVMLLVFPDGRLPSPEWRWVLYALLVVGLIGLVLGITNPTPGVLGLTSVPAPGVTIPASVLAIPGAGGVITALSTAFSVLFVVLGVGVVMSVFLRLRNADADGRHQIKWVAFAATITLATILVLNLIPLGNTGEPPPLYFATAGPVLILAGLAVPVAIGVAVLKYRLYDIDVIISRALLYGALAAFITAIYIGIAVGIGTLVGSGGQPNLWLSIIATIIVAVGFQPVRERVQKVANRLVYGKRATPYEVLSTFSGQVAEAYAADEVLPRMAQVLQQGTGAQSATVWLNSAGTLRAAATSPDVDTPDHAPLSIFKSTLHDIPGATASVPVEHQGQLLGALSVVKRKGETLTPTEEKLIDDLANQAGLVMRNVGLASELRNRLDQLRSSRQRLVHAQDEERRRLERNLHDGAQQHLVALKVKLGLAQMLMTSSPDKAKATLAQLKSDADEALETLRDLARGIYPPLLADKGLVAALESQAHKAFVPVRVEAEGVGRYPQDVEAMVYFCVLEALQNVQKYADPSNVVVRLGGYEGRLMFEVEDDGAGFDIATAKKGAGLTNMVDRVEALGGHVDVISAPGAGTRVSGEVPAAEREAVLA
jgi:signal transduction histidine kinase